MLSRIVTRLALLISLVCGVVVAQSALPRKDIPSIAKAANGSIVSIVMSDDKGKPIAQGTGFVVSKDGLVVTNYHVIAEGSSAVVKLPDGAFYAVDGVLAFDKVRDVAIIKAHGQTFRTLPFGNSDRVEVGEEVVAIGNPLSLESTVSNGIVSGMRTAQDLGGKFLQVTAPISPGSSGGPLFNMAGEVIGITTLYLKGGENLNFAIPINDAKRLLLSKSSTLLDWPNEHESVKTENRDQEQALHSTMAQQKMCADQAKKFFNDSDYNFKSNPFNDYTSHFDAKTNVCYVMVSIDKNQIPEQWAIAYEVYNAFEGVERARLEAKVEMSGPEPKPYACTVELEEERVRCETKDEFFSLIKKHFGLERP
jgi:Trypsin-like peptidase domain